MNRLWIPGRLPGLNEILDAKARFEQDGRRRHTTYARVKAERALHIVLQARISRLKPIEKGFFTYLFVEPNRKRDPSNFTAGGRKIIEDALISGGYLPNDGWKQVLGYSDYWITNREHPGVFLVVDEYTGRSKGDMVVHLCDHLNDWKKAL